MTELTCHCIFGYGDRSATRSPAEEAAVSEHAARAADRPRHAVAVNRDGFRESLGLDVVTSKDEAA